MVRKSWERPGDRLLLAWRLEGRKLVFQVVCLSGWVPLFTLVLVSVKTMLNY